MSIIANSFGGRIASSAQFPELQPLLARIKAAYRPVEIILYGSRARGEATDQSDWDLKVIVADDAPDHLLHPMMGWRLQEGCGVYADVTCTRVSDFQADLDIANSAVSHMVDDGVVLDVR